MSHNPRSFCCCCFCCWYCCCFCCCSFWYCGKNRVSNKRNIVFLDVTQLACSRQARFQVKLKLQVWSWARVLQQFYSQFGPSKGGTSENGHQSTAHDYDPTFFLCKILFYSLSRFPSALYTTHFDKSWKLAKKHHPAHGINNFCVLPTYCFHNKT